MFGFFQPSNLFGPWKTLKSLPRLPAENDLACCCQRLGESSNSHAIRKTPCRQYLSPQTASSGVMDIADHFCGACIC